ncbi:MAG: hypothetical protein HOB52_00765, partial [Euryarchaeota archaeon]|nr:hypothetical protein [Euryarchaeota archaeon]
MSVMKIAILGAGAIGTVIAGSLASIPNVELLLSSRGEQALALMTTGLKLTGVVEKEISDLESNSIYTKQSTDLESKLSNVQSKTKKSQ